MVPEVPLFSLSSIKKATNHFSRINLIGKGGYGFVFKVSKHGKQLMLISFFGEQWKFFTYVL